MANKRALIVDDSRSARVILSRMLEAHGLQVDTAESGEQALEYLKDARPDVVFMDHLMPGMDGFETVKIIKNNTLTESIPVMMYTSQEGDDYVREARALGAAGVLSKTLLPTDVARALYQLQLLPDRRDLHASDAMPAPASSVPPAPNSINSLREPAADLKRYLEASLEQTARRLSNEIRSAMPIAPPIQNEKLARVKAPRGLIAALILFALVPTMVVGFLMWRLFETGKSQLDQANARLATLVAEQQTQIEALRAELRNHDASEPVDDGSVRKETLPVVYGEPPLAGTRVEHLRKLFERLRAEGFKGKVRVEYFTGDFCLVGNAASGYTLANAELQQRRCDLIGSPYDDGLSPAQRESSEYTSLVRTISQATRGAIQVATVDGGRKLSVAYPPQSESLTAGDWNRVAERNHRVEITLQPAS
ncbi:MAG TPA: response regulator [Steroidobacteraceae bacterium]|nr:response regulator [Steroidobacteraceae bacterium]